MQRTDASTDELVAISVRVPRRTAAAFKEIADANYRPVAAELRRLIEARIAQADAVLEQCPLDVESRRAA